MTYTLLRHYSYCVLFLSPFPVSDLAKRKLKLSRDIYCGEGGAGEEKGFIARETRVAGNKYIRVDRISVTTDDIWFGEGAEPEHRIAGAPLRDNGRRDRRPAIFPLT